MSKSLGKPRNKHIESTEQKKFVKMLDEKMPNLHRIMCPIVKTNIIQGKIQKDMGYQRGTLDIYLILKTKKHCGLALEFKKPADKYFSLAKYKWVSEPAGKLSKEQEKTIEALIVNGWSAKVVYNCEEALKELREYLHDGI